MRPLVHPRASLADGGGLQAAVLGFRHSQRVALGLRKRWSAGVQCHFKGIISLLSQVSNLGTLRCPTRPALRGGEAGPGPWERQAGRRPRPAPLPRGRPSVDCSKARAATGGASEAAERAVFRDSKMVARHSPRVPCQLPLHRRSQNRLLPRARRHRQVRGGSSPAENSLVATVTAEVAQTLEPSRTLGTTACTPARAKGRSPCHSLQKDGRPRARCAGEAGPPHGARPEHSRWWPSKAAREPGPPRGSRMKIK